MPKLFTIARRRPGLAALVLLALVSLPFVADTAVNRLYSPLVAGTMKFDKNFEVIQNNTDDMVSTCGNAGTADVCVRFDLDGAVPEIVGRTASDAAAGGLSIGTTGQTATVIGLAASAGPITMENGETIDTTTDAQFRVTRNTAGTVVFMGADNATPADTTYDTTGAGAIVIGSADVTSVTITADGAADADFEVPLTSIASDEIVNDTLTFAQISDSSAVDASTTFTLADAIALTFTATHTIGDTNAFVFNVSQVDDAVATDDTDAMRINLASESNDAGDTLEGLVITYANGTANTVLDSAIAIDNAETTASTMTDAILVTSSGVDSGVVDGLDVSAANITNAVNIGVNPIACGNSDSFQAGVTDALFQYTRNTAGMVSFAGADDAGAADSAYDTTGAGMVFLGSLDVTDVIAIAAETRVRNGATGSVLLGFQDWGDSAQDTADQAQISVNLTDTGAGTEDADFSICVQEAGAVCETRFFIDADDEITIGSANTDRIVFDTDTDTGDADIVLPLESVGAGEILNLTRSHPLPLGSWVPCAGTVAGVWDAAGADTEPDLVAVNSALTIKYDATGGEIDVDEVCNSFTVPADYASGGTFVFRVTQDAATGANIESIECRISVDGAAIGAADEDNLVNQTAVQSVTSAPTGTWAAGASIGVLFKQGLAAADDHVNVHSVEFQYVATQ